MEKALKIGKSSATGSFHMFVGVAVSNIILAVGAIILARLLTRAEYGFYTVALIPSLMLVLFRDWGMTVAITKNITHFRVKKEEGNIREVILAGLIFEIITGVALSIISLFFANFIATTIFHRPESALLISIISSTIFAGSLISTAQWSFVGFQKMELQSITLICQAIVRVMLSLALVFLGFGALGAAVGYTFSFLAAGILSSILLYLFIFRNLERKKIDWKKIYPNLKSMLHFGVPFSISTISEGFLLQFFGFMMASYCSDVLIGEYQVATTFAVLLTFFTIPLETVLFPVFSKLDSQKDPHTLKTVFTSSVKYTAMLIVPATTAIIVLSKPMIATLYGEKWVLAPFFLALYALRYLLSGVGYISLSSLIVGIGKTRALMKLSFLTLIIGIPLAFILIPTMNIVGVILSYILSSIPSMFIGIFWIWKRYEITVDWGSSAKIFLASGIASAVTYLALNFINTVEWLRLIAGGTIFLTVFIVVAPSIKAIVQDDIKNLRAMLSPLGFILKVANIPLSIIEKIAGILYVKEKSEVIRNLK